MQIRPAHHAGVAGSRGREGSAAGRAPWAPPIVAAVALALMLVTAVTMDLPIRDPDASLVGSPLLLILLMASVFLIIDVVPRGIRLSRSRPDPGLIRSLSAVLRERWANRRGVIVLVALFSFYVTYLSYRNVKSYLPFVRDELHDLGLLSFERWLFSGTDPAEILHSVLGTGFAAHVLSFVYLAFLTFVPLSLGAALIWSSRLRVGLWYVTSLSITWILGAVSYYLIPSLGPAYVRPGLFSTLPETGVTRLQETLLESRHEVLANPQAADGVQSIAAFASLHVGIIFTAALIAHLVGAPRPMRIALWVFLGLTWLSTVYFGWHYLVDDAAGLVIGLAAVYIGGRVTGCEWRPLLRRPPRVAQSSASAA